MVGDSGIDQQRPKSILFRFENGYLTSCRYFDGVKWRRSYPHNPFDAQSVGQWQHENMEQIQRLFRKQIGRFIFDDDEDVHSVMRKDVPMGSTRVKLDKELPAMGLTLILGITFIVCLVVESDFTAYSAFISVSLLMIVYAQYIIWRLR